MAMGDALAAKVKVVLASVNIKVDVVIPVWIFLFLECLVIDEDTQLRFPIRQELPL